MNEVRDDQGEPIHQRYLLSLQDMDRSAYLQELIDAGVTTFKIEGRLKDAEYVTNITAYYREKLDRCAQRAKTAALKEQRAIYNRSFEPNPEKTFHRGATEYFLHGRTRPMANWETPKSTGEYIGEVVEAHGNTLRVRLKKGVVLHNGDGLTIGGRELFRNLDMEFTKSLKSERRIPVDIVLSETEEGFELSYRSAFSFQHSVFSYPHEPAKNAEKALETIRTQLSKLGDTPYIAREIRIESAPYFIPISVLNEWRRNTII